MAVCSSDYLGAVCDFLGALVDALIDGGKFILTALWAGLTDGIESIVSHCVDRGEELTSDGDSNVYCGGQLIIEFPNILPHDE